MDLNPERIVAWGTIVATAFGAMWAVRAYTVKSLRRLARIEKRVNLMWSFQMTRAYAEAVQSGLAAPGSGQYALTLSPEVRARFDAIAPDLHQLYLDNPDCSQDELRELIESQWQQWLVDNVCLPLNVHHGACLIFAYEVAREAAAHLSTDHRD